MRPVRTAARTLLSGILVISGARAVADPDALTPRVKPLMDRIAPLIERVDPRLPTDTRAMVRVNGAVQVTGGLLLATGHLTRLAAATLAGSMVPATVADRPFWMHNDPMQRVDHRTQFLKNLAIIGGLLLAAADTQGRPGLGWRTTRAVRHGQRSVQRAMRTVRRDARLAATSVSAAGRLPTRIP